MPSREKLAISSALLTSSALLLWDILGDLGRGGQFDHIAIEVCILALLLGSLLWLIFINQQLGREVRQLSVNLSSAFQEAKKWRQETEVFILGLSSAIDRQFQDWQFSNAEKEIALLLIKGLSLKEIAELRQTSERTVRQQAQHIYTKSNLGGRAELAAFFLEDLLQPMNSNQGVSK